MVSIQYSQLSSPTLTSNAKMANTSNTRAQGHSFEGPFENIPLDNRDVESQQTRQKASKKRKFSPTAIVVAILVVTAIGIGLTIFGIELSKRSTV